MPPEISGVTVSLEKGDLGSGIVVVVKKLKPEGFQGRKEWLGQNRLLVYEFMPKGSLDNYLRRGPQPLSWSVRMKVAIGAAKGLAFLHNAQSQVIFRDFKTSNILLDAEFDAKLSDFGLLKAGHVSPLLMNIYGYKYLSAEDATAGLLTAEGDVYSFGVVLLELLFGRLAVKGGTGQNLVEWAKPCLGDQMKLFRIMDTELEGQYPQKGAFTAATLALQCLNLEVKARPSMTGVFATLEQIESPTKCRQAF